MDKSFEKIHKASENTPKTREEIIAGKVMEIEKKFGKPIDEIIKEQEKKLSLIAQMVGKDFGMKANFGEIGGGSYFVPEDKTIPSEQWNTIAMDPLILLEFEGVDEFVAAHEGAHRAITRTFDQVGLKPKQEREKYAEKIGWSGICNIGLEDPAVNNYGGTLYPRTKELSDKNYDQAFKEEHSIMTTPVVSQMIQMLGYTPNFIKYASELERYWHKRNLSQNLPDVVEEALKNTLRNAELYWNEIPYTYPTEKDVLNKAKTRWQIYEKGIWPFVQKMIEEDMTDEKLKQYLKEQLKKAIEEMEKEEEQKSKKGGQPQAGEGESLENMMEQFGFDEKEKEEMRQKIKEASERKKEGQKKLKEKLKNGGMSDEEFEKETQEADKNMPMDMKSMSKSAKKKIQDKLNGEPKEIQEKTEKAAKESLEKAEDKANESKKGKIGPKDESHQEQRERQAKEAEEAKKQAGEIAKKLGEWEKQEETFKKWQEEREKSRNAWEKAVSEQAKTIDELYRLIEELFQKKKHPRWKKGFSAGQRLDLGVAMQYEADPRNYTRLWEKKTIPEKYDYRFILLNDQSGSMREGRKAENDLIAKAIVTEVLAALGIPCEILGFTTPANGKFENNVEIYKGFREELNEERDRIMKKLSEIVIQGGGATPTYTATRIASEKLALERESTKNHAHFLFVITDGEPYDDPVSSNIDDLKELNKKLSEENDQVIIGMGIGDGISEEKLVTAYGKERYVYAKNPEEFPKKMAALLEAIFTQSQGIR